jgi:methylenetetrahydrofolate dehydrogenase (NADP+)/methenyltetrahydrofolate cyclohydrolase
MILIDGKKIAAEVKTEIAAEVAKIKAEGKKVPHLAAILVGSDGASETYVASKVKSCAEVGFDSSLFRFPSDATEEEVLAKVREVNLNPDIDGLIVQLPLPGHISEDKVNETILPSKDVDGFHPVNLGRLVIGLPTFVSATPAGIMELLRRYNIQTSGKECVVIGRSNIVGKPMAILMMQKAYPGDCTVTVVNSRTPDIAAITRRADIVIAALGKPGFLKADMIKEGAVVIDVGITRVANPESKSGWKILGDVAFEEVSQKAAYLTPVPGGVGLMTIVSLLTNTLHACRGDVYGRG